MHPRAGAGPGIFQRGGRETGVSVEELVADTTCLNLSPGLAALLGDTQAKFNRSGGQHIPSPLILDPPLVAHAVDRYRYGLKFTFRALM